jgi:hypothetical protein
MGNEQKIAVEESEWEDQLKSLDVDGLILLKLILKK